jgi:cytidylate kinase
VRLHGVVALDGPSGTGKSTVARQLATELGARYLDTGAMYRAATLGVLEAGNDPTDAERVAALVTDLVIEVGTDPQRSDVRLNGRQVAGEIRSAAVTTAVSPVSAVPAVRRVLVAQQRRLINDAGAIVVEGRDVGSIVWPHAELKVYLTASSTERARRRAAELGGRQPGEDIADVEADLQRRDHFDSSRQVGPLSKAPDAIELDTTDLDINDVVARLIDLLRSRGKAALRG